MENSNEQMTKARKIFPSDTAAKWFDKSFGTEHVWPIDLRGDGQYSLMGIAADGTAQGEFPLGSTSIPKGTVFPPSANWYSPSFNQRVWPADVTGNGKMDLVGVAEDGRIYTALNYSHSVGINYIYEFRPSSYKPESGESEGSSFTSANGWFDNKDSRDRVWPADILGNGVAAIIGISTDGRVYFALSYGDGSFSKVNYIETEIFTTKGGWFSRKYNQRVWSADVTGSGKADLVGVGGDGRIYVSLNKTEKGKVAFSDYYISGVSGSGMTDSADWFNTQYTERVWVADIDGDGNDDIVGLSNDGYLYYYLSKGNGYFENCVKGPYVGFAGVGNWFSNKYNQRVWLMDVTGNGKADFVGVNFAGEVEVIENSWF